jgi:tetratricopeptide (TPR) repeat protein
LAAIELDPDFARAFSLLARIYGFIGEEAPTLEYAHKALELDPDLGSAYAWISLMYSRTGRFEEALEFAEQAYQRSPSDPEVLGRYGNRLVARGHDEQAIGVLERAIELDPANYLAYSNLSWARWYAGDRDRGVVAMRRALELTPDIFNIHRSLGMMEAALGNRAEGVAQVQLAERLNSNPQPSVLTAYGYRVVGLHDDAARVARAWAETLEELPQGDLLFVLYHLVLVDEEQALDALVRLIENPPGSTVPTMWVMNNAFDDPTLEKPEFAALRAELRAKIGRN